MWFHKGGRCGCFILINKWCTWVQSALLGIWLYVQLGSKNIIEKLDRLYYSLPTSFYQSSPLNLNLKFEEVKQWSNISIIIEGSSHQLEFIMDPFIFNDVGSQWNQIGRFLEAFDNNFLSKVAKMFGDLLGYF